MSGFADRIFGYFAILQQMSGFADRIFGYFEISLQQVQAPGTGTVSATQILISGYWWILTLFQDICRIFGAKTSDILSHDGSLIIGYSRILSRGYRRRPYSRDTYRGRGLPSRYSIKFKNGNLRVFLERKKKSARRIPRENHRFRIIIDYNAESVVFTRNPARASFFPRNTLRIPFLNSTKF